MRGTAALVVALGGCGFPALSPVVDVHGDAAATTDARADASVDAPVHDATSCPLLSSYNPTFGSQSATQFGGDPGDQAPGDELVWQGAVSGSGALTIVITTFAGSGAMTPDWPASDVTTGAVSLTENGDAQLALGVDFDGSAFQGTVYAATAGTLTITNVTTAFSGTATNVVLQHVDAGNGGGYVADPDGCMSAISSMSFDGTLSAARN
jgi:hypothetical protein